MPPCQFAFLNLQLEDSKRRTERERKMDNDREATAPPKQTIRHQSDPTTTATVGISAVMELHSHKRDLPHHHAHTCIKPIQSDMIRSEPVKIDTLLLKMNQTNNNQLQYDHELARITAYLLRFSQSPHIWSDSIRPIQIKRGFITSWCLHQSIEPTLSDPKQHWPAADKSEWNKQ